MKLMVNMVSTYHCSAYTCIGPTESNGGFGAFRGAISYALSPITPEYDRLIWSTTSEFQTPVSGTLTAGICYAGGARSSTKCELGLLLLKKKTSFEIPLPYNNHLRNM